ncbi:SdpI family protein [Saccharomonospora iraqiensis]|uniref:SdpI family protein n=1 Tax=Saccharomonospora iraqiensis TaxID=52698 RepID=UPI00054D3B2B|nr:SdpI family protein [Saccharomonospora iraqiensis]
MEDVVGFAVFAGSLFLVAGLVHWIRNATRDGNLGRNFAVGLRTKVTLSSDAAWEAGHRAAGPWLVRAAWTGYAAGATAAVLAVARALTDTTPVIALVVPGAGMLAMLALIVLGCRRADSAGRDTDADAESG